MKEGVRTEVKGQWGVQEWKVEKGEGGREKRSTAELPHCVEVESSEEETGGGKARGRACLFKQKGTHGQFSEVR